MRVTRFAGAGLELRRDVPLARAVEIRAHQDDILIDRRRAVIRDLHLDLAVVSEAGGRLARDGRQDVPSSGFFVGPTLIEQVAPDNALFHQELFGPVTCLYRVKGFDEAVALANATAFGLTGAIHTRNCHRIEEFITRYQAGLVSINGPTYGAGPHMPFGGVKNSGNGFREPGTEALDVYCEWKTVVVNHDPAGV